MLADQLSSDTPVDFGGEVTPLQAGGMEGGNNGPFLPIQGAVK